MDADEFLGKLQKLAELLKQGKISEIDINLLIASTPIVDAVEVVHGYWDVEVGMNYNKERICPVCNKHIESNYWNYCPNCGAKMDR